MALKQREMNRMALKAAASFIRDADFTQIFDDAGDGSERDNEVLDKAQAYAVRRIMSLQKTAAHGIKENT
jgi:hypothetical protein